MQNSLTTIYRLETYLTMRNKVPLKQYAPFDPVQQEYIFKARDSWFNVAEGSKRAGKNIMNVFSFCYELEYHPHELHLIAGYSSGAAGALIYRSDGYGMERYFHGRSVPGKYEGKPCYYINTFTGEKVVLRTGGRDILSQDSIAGYTFGMAYVTEANRCHPEFVKEVFSRTFSSQNRKVYHDINPKSEAHWYYEDVLNFHEAAQRNNPDYGFNYGHFTMANNLSMSDEQIRDVIRSVPKGTIWYARDILGERKQAEGLIYPHFDRKKHVKPSEKRQYEKFFISMDYGIHNATVMILWGLYKGVWYAVEEYYHSGRKTNDQKTDEEYYQELVKLADKRKIEAVIIDPSASSFITLIRRKSYFLVRKAHNALLEGIAETAMALSDNKIAFNDCCTQTIREFGLYSWNEKSTDDVPIMEDDHCMDAVRYFVKTQLRGGTKFIG